MEHEIVQTILDCQVTVIAGATGCGKVRIIVSFANCLCTDTALALLTFPPAWPVLTLKFHLQTTQVPQLVLDDLIVRCQGAAANIVVTQPRRISAIGVSERIAEERCEKVGETCGYSIKLEKKMSSQTRLLLCTTGVLLRRLQCDPDLAAVSHIFVDEVRF
jgi:HrpA-like RNA helicase